MVKIGDLVLFISTKNPFGRDDAALGMITRCEEKHGFVGYRVEWFDGMAPTQEFPEQAEAFRKAYLKLCEELGVNPA